jgi:hypothetical protein
MRRASPASGDQPAPGEEGGPALGRRLAGLREGRHGALEVAQRRLAAADARERGREARHDAAEAGVGRQRPEDGLGRDEPLGRRLHLVERQQEQAVALEEGAALRQPHGADVARVLPQPGRQRGGRLVGQFRRRGVDHRHDGVGLPGEGRVERGPLPPPLEVGGEQLRRVGGDGEVAPDVEQRRRPEEQAEQQHAPRPAAARRDDPAGEGHPGAHAAARDARNGAPAGGRAGRRRGELLMRPLPF